MSRRLSLLLLPVVLLLSGCLISQSRVNRPLAPEAIAGLRIGMGADEVVLALGAPVQVVELGERSAYRFEFERNKNTGLFLFVFNWSVSRTASDRVWCFFSADDKLTHMATTLEADGVSYGLE